MMTACLALLPPAERAAAPATATTRASWAPASAATADDISRENEHPSCDIRTILLRLAGTHYGRAWLERAIGRLRDFKDLRVGRRLDFHGDLIGDLDTDGVHALDLAREHRVGAALHHRAHAVHCRGSALADDDPRRLIALA
jgi:hypothetical protein